MPLLHAVDNRSNAPPGHDRRAIRTPGGNRKSVAPGGTAASATSRSARPTAAAKATKDMQNTACSNRGASLAGPRRFIHLSNFAGQKMPGAGQSVIANNDGTPCCQRLNDKVQSLFRGRNSPLH